MMIILLLLIPFCHGFYQPQSIRMLLPKEVSLNDKQYQIKEVSSRTAQIYLKNQHINAIYHDLPLSICREIEDAKFLTEDSKVKMSQVYSGKTNHLFSFCYFESKHVLTVLKITRHYEYNKAMISMDAIFTILRLVCISNYIFLQFFRYLNQKSNIELYLEKMIDNN